MASFVISDSSPLIGLAAAGVFDRLRELFDTVMITRIVLDEIMAGRGMPGADDLSAAMRAGWIRVAPAPAETWRFAELGAGEASTIALALECEPSQEARVLMDDALGRAQAAALGLEVVDLPSLLLAFKRNGLVEDVRPIFERLARRGFVVPEASIRKVLAAAGEAEPGRDDIGGF
jgi:predicted nucleic acid-binding protein